MPSVMHRMIQSAVAGHDDGWSAMSISNGIASRSRVIVTAFAGVASAEGPNEVSESVTSGRFEIRSAGVGHGHRGEGTDGQCRRDRDDAVDLRRLAVRPPGARLVHEDFDRGADQF